MSEDVFTDMLEDDAAADLLVDLIVAGEIDPRRGLPSASSLERLHNCPGSWLATKDLPDESNADSEAGTRIHRALETGDMTGLSADEEQTAEMCRAQGDKVLGDWNPDMDGIAYKEQRLGLTRIGGVVDVTDDTKADLVFTGQADLIVIDGNRGLVLDYKTGRGEVADAAENLQLRGLAVMAARRWRLESVRVAIVRPWAGPASVADYDAGALISSRNWMMRLLEAVKAATPNDLNPGAWCHYCKAKAICPALRSVALEPVEHMALTLPADDATARAALFARAMEMTPQRLTALYRGLKLVGWYQAAIEGAMRKRVEEGEIPGFRMKPGQIREKITDVGAVWAKCEGLGVKAQDFTGACSVTKDALKTLLRDATGSKGKALDATIKNVLHGATESKETAQQIEEVKA
jgi:hypothetical protein